MATDLLAMRTEIQEHGFTDTSTARLNALINDAYYDVCSRYPWPFLEAETTVTLTTGSSTPASAPAALRSVLALVDDSSNVGSPLLPERWDVLAKRFAGSLTVNGQPQYYYFVGDVLRTFPPSDGAHTLTLKYLQYPVALANDTDQPIVPDRHRRVIVLGALVGAYRMEDDPELAAVFEQQFEKRIQMMVEDVTRKQYDRSARTYILNDDDEWFDW